MGMVTMANRAIENAFHPFSEYTQQSDGIPNVVTDVITKTFWTLHKMLGADLVTIPHDPMLLTFIDTGVRSRSLQDAFCSSLSHGIAIPPSFCNTKSSESLRTPSLCCKIFRAA